MRNRGFTLIEVIVSIVVSAILLTVVLQTFWLLIEVNQKNEALRDLQRQTNFALLRLSDKIKNYGIDYRAYTDQASGICQNLSLDTGTQNRLCLNNGYEFQQKNHRLLMNNQPLLGEKYDVETAYFLITPKKDPFEDISQRESQLQPKVTVYLKIKSKKYKDIALEIQTTISSRKYKK